MTGLLIGHCTGNLNENDLTTSVYWITTNIMYKNYHKHSINDLHSQVQITRRLPIRGKRLLSSNSSYLNCQHVFFSEEQTIEILLIINFERNEG